MSDVRESDYFAAVQNSALGSPHLTASIPEQDMPEFELAVPIGPPIPPDLRQYHVPIPDIDDLDDFIKTHEKEFYGVPDRGVIGAIVPTRESRLLGIAAILGNFEEYKHVKKLTKTQINVRSHHLDEIRNINGQVTSIREHLDGASAELFSVFVELVEINDEIIQILSAVKNHIPRKATSMSDAEFEQFADDALVVFARDDVNRAIRESIARLRHKRPQTKDS